MANPSGWGERGPWLHGDKLPILGYYQLTPPAFLKAKYYPQD